MSGIGIFGILCEAKTVENLVRKTESGPLHPAVCNRWANHDGLHRQTRGADFAVLHEFGEDEVALPDVNDAKRKEMAVSKKGNQ